MIRKFISALGISIGCSCALHCQAAQQVKALAAIEETNETSITASEPETPEAFNPLASLQDLNKVYAI